MKYEPDDDIEERSFLQRYGFLVGIVVLAGLAVLVFAGRNLFSGSHSSGPPRAQEILMVKLPPPPPPPPPPQVKPPEPKPEEKMIEQAPVEKEEQKPDEKPPDQPQVGTNIKGNGSDGFNLANGSGNGPVAGNNRGRGSGSKWGWYASEVQARIADALRNNRKTRSADVRIEVRIWPDATGRISRAELAGTTGDASMDAAIKNEVLTGLRLQEPPPAGMPSPIVLRITARRPN